MAVTDDLHSKGIHRPCLSRVPCVLHDDHRTNSMVLKIEETKGIFKAVVTDKASAEVVIRFGGKKMIIFRILDWLFGPRQKPKYNFPKPKDPWMPPQQRGKWWKKLW